MANFLIRRTFLLLVTMLITSIIVFGLTQLLPGDVARLIMGRDASPQAIEQFRQEFGLDDPIPEQYVRWLSGFISGDWGISFSQGNPAVRPLVMARLGNTLRLSIVTLAISIPLSILLGVVAALRENSWLDNIISVLSLSVVGLPEFVTALILINGIALGIPELNLPTTSLTQDSFTLGDWIRILILPAITATLVLLGYVSRMARAGVIDELKQPYVRTARLKGLPQRTIIFKHVLRNALLPTITVIAISVGWLIGGIVVIERVFTYPGLGALMVDAVEQKNLPMLQASVMVIIFFFALANLIADILYAMLNPRIRLS